MKDGRKQGGREGEKREKAKSSPWGRITEFAFLIFLLLRDSG